MKYLEYFEQETKDLEKRSKVVSKTSTYWEVTEERHKVDFEYANEVAELSCNIKYDKNGGYEEVWYSSYGQQSRKSSNVKDAVENAKYMIDDWKAWKYNGAIPEVDKEYDDHTWVYVEKYPEKGELMIVADVRYTITLRRNDRTYDNRTITVRGKDDLYYVLTPEVSSFVEKLLD